MKTILENMGIILEHWFHTQYLLSDYGIIILFRLISGIVSEVDCCLILNETENVAVQYSGLSPGTTATFTCVSGFELVGASTLMCGDSCQWSDLPPTCRRKHPSHILSFLTLCECLMR